LGNASWFISFTTNNYTLYLNCMRNPTLPQFLSATALLVLLGLSACSPNVRKSTSEQQSPGHLLNLSITPADDKSALTQKYGGEVIAWQPNDGFAILRLSDKARSSLLSSGVSLQNTKLEPNARATLGDMTAAGVAGWAEGFSAWAGGWSAWAGGWSAWAGGVGIDSPAANNHAWSQIRLPRAHSVVRRFGQGIKVAVIDTGIDPTHPIFNGRLAPRSEWRDYVDRDTNPTDVPGGPGYGHGTAVASIVLQVAPRATILPIRVLDTNGEGDTDKIAQAIIWAVRQGASVINLSLGSRQYSESLFRVSKYANKQGIMIFAAAGNTGGFKVAYPGRFTWKPETLKKTVSIGSLDRRNYDSDFNADGLWGPDELYATAPGEQITAAYPGARMINATGTSFATPMFSGAAALALGDMPNPADRIQLADVFWKSVENVISNSGNRALNTHMLINNLPGWSEPIYSLVSANSLKCLAPSSGAPGARMVQIDCANSSTQWKLTYALGIYKIVNLSTGQALTVNNGNPGNGANVVQRPYAGSNNQNWIIRPLGGGYEIVAQHSNRCLDVLNVSKKEGAPLQQWACTKGDNQKWRLRLLN
jgi:subtilisin family serine protease